MIFMIGSKRMEKNSHLKLISHVIHGNNYVCKAKNNSKHDIGFDGNIVVFRKRIYFIHELRTASKELGLRNT